MDQQDFVLTFEVDQSPREVFDAIRNVPAWWSTDFSGRSQEEGDEFEVRFNDIHISSHKLVEVVPDEKITWLVTDSRLNFLSDVHEWNGTKNIFEIIPGTSQTTVRFTHEGLVPAIQCFRDCSQGWNQYMKSLSDFVTTGKGQPHLA